MAKIKELHIWMQNRKMNWKEPEVVNSQGKMQKGKRVVLEIADGTPVAEMKVEVAKILKQYKKQLLYYYVVAVVEREDGEFGFRTIVPKVYMGRPGKWLSTPTPIPAPNAFVIVDTTGGRNMVATRADHARNVAGNGVRSITTTKRRKGIPMAFEIGPKSETHLSNSAVNNFEQKILTIVQMLRDMQPESKSIKIFNKTQTCKITVSNDYPTRTLIITVTNEEEDTQFRFTKIGCRHFPEGCPECIKEEQENPTPNTPWLAASVDCGSE